MSLTVLAVVGALAAMGAAGSAPDNVAQTLSGMGAAGAAITVLMTTVSALVGAIVILFKANSRLHAERKAELAAFSKLVEANNAALTKVAESTEERNRVTEALAEAIKVQANAFEMVNERIGFYHSGNLEKLNAIATVLGAQSEAVRVNTGMVTDARNSAQAAVNSLAEVKATLPSLIAKLDGVLQRRSR